MFSAWAIPVARMLPFIRAFTSLVSGVARIPAIRFGVLNLIGTVIYAAALSSIGYALGSVWQRVSHGLAVAGYILFAVLVIAIVAFIAHRWRQVRRETGAHAASAAGPGGASGRAPGGAAGPAAGGASGAAGGPASATKPRSHRSNSKV